MKYYGQIVFIKGNGKIESVSPIITINAWSKAMAKRRIAKKCDFMIEGLSNYVIVIGENKEYRARLILLDKLGNPTKVVFRNVKAVCFECAEFQMNLLIQKMSNDPLVELLELKIEVVWEE